MPILPALDPAIRVLRSEETERLHTLYSDLPRTLADCVTCQGSRRFLWYADGTPATEPVEWTCDCEGQFILHRFLLHSGIELHYQRLSWNDLEGADQQAQDVAVEYGANAANYASSGVGLVLHGNRGTGKTLLATLLMKALLNNGYDGYFTTFHHLIDVFTQTWRDKPEKEWFDQRIRNAGILVIDDIGREYKGRIEMVESLLDHVIRARVGAERPTIITTNKEINEFTQLYQQNVLSLLTESSIIHKFRGEDFRPTFNVRKIAEARAGLRRPVVVA